MKYIKSKKTGTAFQKVTAADLVEYLVRNTDNEKLAGLYNGKAGLSIALFSASKHLQDEKIEDLAYTLIQEALVIKTNDFSFENGLSGIGYALLYLIENNYIEADFDEVFGAQCNEIIRFFENIDKNPDLLVNLFTVIYFLSKVDRVKDDKRIRLIIKKIFEGLELFFIIHFLDFYDFHYIGIKTDVLNIYKTYLRLIDYSGYTDFSRSVLEDYAALYRKGKVVSSLEIGYYLKLITNKYQITGYEDVISDNIRFGTATIFPVAVSLRDRIDPAKLMNSLNICETKDMQLDIKGLNKEVAIKNLLKTVDEKHNPLGYGAGLARLLIYDVDSNIELL